MPLKDLLKKKDKIRDEGATSSEKNGPTLSPDVPEFQFFRTTTSTHEAIEPPSFPGDPTRSEAPLLSPKDTRGFGRFRRHSNGRQRSGTLSERLHFGRTRSTSSVNVPDNLPDVGTAVVARNEEDEARWEKRATVLVQQGQLAQSMGGSSAPPTPTVEVTDAMGSMGFTRADGRPGVQRQPSAPTDEENIQEAIRLHEKGNLEASTALFGRLADPSGANNALAQVLYGLALRHAWGIEANQEQAVHYLSLAASNSAEVEKLALGAGMKKGGAAKGELVLAMYELANCFRNGWGIKKDPAAAKQYYETAANLGDTDAMNEVAWCYTEGFGTKKDKFKAAQFLRLAEAKGNKTLGNTWYVAPPSLCLSCHASDRFARTAASRPACYLPVTAVPGRRAPATCQAHVEYGTRANRDYLSLQYHQRPYQYCSGALP
ncbi:HCP-like protein [Lizonia empirigonia]|nr:HCP-like protein [Lizonia empirigonia]